MSVPFIMAEMPLKLRLPYWESQKQNDEYKHSFVLRGNNGEFEVVFFFLIVYAFCRSIFENRFRCIFEKFFFLTKSIIFTGKKKKEPTILDTWCDLKGCVLNVTEYCTAAF